MKKVLGVTQEKYNTMAHSHSKAAITLWLLGGFGFIFYQGSIVSLATILLLLPGIFIISIFSALPFMFQMKTRDIVFKRSPVLALILTIFWSLLDLILPIALSVGYILLIQEVLF
jgi:hypothetical protein